MRGTQGMSSCPWGRPVPPTHELPPGLTLGWVGSCFTMGETMVGCGMPEGCSPWVGGGTMCGEKRLDIKLRRREREGRARQLPTGTSSPQFPPQTFLRTSGVESPPASTQLGVWFYAGSRPSLCRTVTRTQRKQCPKPTGCRFSPTRGDHPHTPGAGFGRGGHHDLLGLVCARAEPGSPREHPLPTLPRG